MISIITDMHMHTTFSDGLNTPSEIVSMAIEKKIDVIAITDHDTIDGISEAMEFAKGKNIKIIPGIEISCVHGGEEVHILGYFIDYEDKKIINMTRDLKVHRYNRAIEIVEKLNALGVDLDFEEVRARGENKSIGRPLIGHILIEKGYVKDMEEAFSSYLGNDAPAFVEKFKLKVPDAIDYIHNAGGITVVAHPGDLSRENFLEVIKFDLQGVECIHPKHDEELSEYFMKIARENKLKITAGSDFHGEGLKGRDGMGDYTLEVESIDYFTKRGE